MKAFKIIIHGKVQGVYFRQSTKAMAQQLHITGWVQNNPDKTIEIFAEGNEDNIKTFIKWCHQGPPSARVLVVDAEEAALQNFTSFSILR